tara:strand:- start:13205 stop:14203 length:999 start_codon:yes stop_codon:yes gene_type:complete
LVKNKYGIGIIGCGLIGYKRAANIDGNSKIKIFCDVNLEKAKTLSKEFGGNCTTDWRQVIEAEDVDIVIISTVHNILADIALYCVELGKPVLIEKPGACRPRELDELIEVSKNNNIQVHVGYNHRFHPAFLKAKEIINNDIIGETYFIRAHYGHGGRIGYENEWRADKKISGGGELIDQGTHLIDLSMWLFNEDFIIINGETKTYFWNMDVDDNVFLTLETSSNKIAHLHASWTEWKNEFFFEIVGSVGKICINGLGGSYGTEKLVLYKMRPEMGPPDSEIWEWPNDDSSWSNQWSYFVNEIMENKTECNPGLASSRQVLNVVDKIYNKGNL